MGPRWLRTVCATYLTSNMCLSTSESNRAKVPLIAKQQEVATAHSQTIVTLADFIDSLEELKEQKDRKTRILMYVFQTYLLHQQCKDDAKESLSDVWHFIDEKQLGAVGL